MQPDPSLSPAALDVMAELESLAREHPEASGPDLAAMLARRWCPARLRRREYRDVPAWAAWAGAYAFVLGAAFLPLLIAASAAFVLWLAGVG